MEEGLAVAFDCSELAKIDCDLKYQANGPENCRSKGRQAKFAGPNTDKRLYFFCLKR
jgi:hypothetical protein